MRSIALFAILLHDLHLANSIDGVRCMYKDVSIFQWVKDLQVSISERLE